MEPAVLSVIAVLIMIVVIQVVIIRWVLRINEIVSVLNEQADYLEDMAFHIKKCAEKMGVSTAPYDEDIITAKNTRGNESNLST